MTSRFPVHYYITKTHIACNKLEDEFHFMLECPLYKDIRKIYIKEYFWKYPNIPKFIQLLTSDNKELNINIALIVRRSFELRKIYNCNYN